MSGKKDQPSTNLLFSPANDLFNTGSPSAFLVPVQGPSTSALMTSESDPTEVDSFLGQNSSQQPATFSLFSGDPTGNDPFSSSVISADQSTGGGGVTTLEQEPQLFVPPSTGSSYGSPSNYPYSYGASPAFNQPMQMESRPPTMSSPATNSSSIPPPPSQPYISTPSSRSPYANPRYVVPDYNNISVPASARSSSPGQMPPPPTSGYTPNPYPPPMQAAPASGPPPSFTQLANSVPPPPSAESMYHAVSAHWCYSKELSDGSVAWHAFSYYDSQRLEESENEAIISTDGGRYDVSIEARERTSVYWEEAIANVRRCTWFSKGDNDHRYVPLDEEMALILEQEYKTVVMNNAWHKQINLGSGEMFVIHNPQVIVQLIPNRPQDDIATLPEQQMRSRVVKRGITETELVREIPESEIGTPDHVVFVCHGIGPVCDLRSRTIVECVDDFRGIQLSLLKSHFKGALETRKASRIEFLPVHWHRALHGDATGVDRDIRRLTLPSIHRLRHFTNETLLDILFYSSPVYCQTIAETIGSELNSLYQLFMSRNPSFQGKVSLSGHSLGSLMLFDLLCHQGTSDQQKLDAQKINPAPLDQLTVPAMSSPARSASPCSTREDTRYEEEVEITLDELLSKLNLNPFREKFEVEQMDMDTLLLCSESDLKDIGLPMGPRKKLIGYLKQQQQERDKKQEQHAAEAKRLHKEKLLKQQQEAEDATMVAGHAQQRLESLTGFMSSAMNVHVDFQQYDSGTGQPMVRYPQLQFEPSMCFALGSPIGMFLTVRGVSDLSEDFCLPTCAKFFNVFHPFDPVAYRIEPLINPDLTLKPVQVPHYQGRKRLHLELRDSLGRMGTELKEGIIKSVKRAIGSMQRFAQNWQSGETADQEVEEEVKKVTDELINQQNERQDDDTVSMASESTQADVGLGKINQGQRVDYVLQERPLESFNDYLFAFQSHFCYWNSEDTVLLMMKEIYKEMEVLSDSQIKKQQTLEQNRTLAPPPVQSYGPTAATTLSMP